MATQAPQVNEDAVQALAEKLASFVATLEPAEAYALISLLRRGAVGEDDVAGYGWWDIKTAPGWTGFLTSALLGVVISEGLIADQEVLEYFYGRGSAVADSKAAQPKATSEGALRPAPAV
jgi:hypothetical protein